MKVILLSALSQCQLNLIKKNSAEIANISGYIVGQEKAVNSKNGSLETTTIYNGQITNLI